LKKIEADHLALTAHQRWPSRTLKVAVEYYRAL
jgi:hypothetical protein